MALLYLSPRCRWRQWRMSTLMPHEGPCLRAVMSGARCLAKWARGVLHRFSVSGLWYFAWEEFSPRIFLHYLPFSSAFLWSHIWWGLNSGFMIPLWELASAAISSFCSHLPSLLCPIPLAPLSSPLPLTPRSSHLLPHFFPANLGVTQMLTLRPSFRFFLYFHY